MSLAAPLPAAGRLLARGVTASTFQLVRGMRDARDRATIQHLMAERRRLLAELARYMNTERHVGSLAALSAAVAESDRTLEAMLGQMSAAAPGARESECTRASTQSS
jgi:hypothetical protein